MSLFVLYSTLLYSTLFYSLYSLLLPGKFGYFLSSTKANTWNEAEADCESRRALLPSVASEDILPRIAEVLAQSNSGNYYVGGRNKAGTWKWLDGSDWSFTAWNAPIEPNNGPGATMIGGSTVQWQDIGPGDSLGQYNIATICQGRD